MDFKTINEIIGINESYQAVEKIKNIIAEPIALAGTLEKLSQLDSRLDYDWFTDYFQSEHGDRVKLKQDYTPDCLCKLLNRLASGETVLDLCSGTGGLTISNWSDGGENRIYFCEEYSERAFVFLLLNMMLRKINGFAVRCDALTGAVYEIYKLCGGAAERIAVDDFDKSFLCELCITNPPYSMTWDNALAGLDSRFIGYGIAPKSKADYAFVLHGLSKLKDGGTELAILPHGVLFRGGSEEEIRENLINENLIDAIIGLPPNLFLNTGIPVFILVIKKGRAEKDILFIDASKDFEKRGKQNAMTSAQIDKIADAYKKRKEIERFSHVASLDEIKRNSYNLNITRYVDTYVKPETVPIEIINKEITEIEKNIENTKECLRELLLEMDGNTAQAQQDLERCIQLFDFLENRQGRISETIDKINALMGTVDMSGCRQVNIENLAEVERVQKNKSYPIGTILVQLSATNGQVVYHDKGGVCDTKYAAVIPKVANTKYLYEAVCASFPQHFYKVKTGLNLQLEELKSLNVFYHDSEITQAVIAKCLAAAEKAEETADKILNQIKAIETRMLDMMFI